MGLEMVVKALVGWVVEKVVERVVERAVERVVERVVAGLVKALVKALEKVLNHTLHLAVLTRPFEPRFHKWGSLTNCPEIRWIIPKNSNLVFDRMVRMDYYTVGESLIAPVFVRLWCSGGRSRLFSNILECNNYTRCLDLW